MLRASLARFEGQAFELARQVVGAIASDFEFPLKAGVKFAKTLFELVDGLRAKSGQLRFKTLLRNGVSGSGREGTSLTDDPLCVLGELRQLLSRKLSGALLELGIGAREGIVEASLKLRSGFAGETFRKFLRITKGLLGKRGESLNAASDVFGAVSIGVQFFFPEGLRVCESRGRKFFSLADAGFPTFFDSAESGLYGIVELCGEGNLHGLFSGELELALESLKELLGGDDDAFCFAGSILFLGGIFRGRRAGKTVTSALRSAWLDCRSNEEG